MVPNGGSIQGPCQFGLSEGNYAMTIEIRADNLAKQGLIMVMTGDGKGKTTAAFGQALRALGHGYRVCIIQFMKGRLYGEVLAIQKYLPDIDLYQYGLDSFVMRDNPAPVDVELARQGLEKAKEVIASGKYDMIILDEINVAMDFKLIPEDDVLAPLENKPAEMDIILTGRYATPRILEIADMVSEVREIKHHYSAGVRNQAGIEY
jgi:cob(I)alamin adenosyltransferase